MQRDLGISRALWSVVVLGLLAATVAVGDEPAAASSPSPEQAAVDSAKNVEKSTFDEWTSREMARSATREIVRTERMRAEESLEKLLAARAALDKAVAENRPEPELAPLRAAVDARLSTVRSSTARMIAETITANQASRDLYTAELELRDKMAATRAAEIAAQEATVATLGDDKAAERDKLKAEIVEARVLREMERQHWMGVRKDTAFELIEASSEACRIARAVAAAEPDAQQKQQFEQFAEQQAAEQQAAEVVLNEAAAAVNAAWNDVYPLQAQAMGGLQPLCPDCWDYAKARHLLVRAGFGGTPEEVAKLQAMGLYGAVDYLIQYYRQPWAEVAFDPTPLLQYDPLENKMRVTFLRGRLVGVDKRAVEVNQEAQLRRWWLQRLVESPRPLQEKLTLFWHGHFATQDSVVQNSYTMFRQLQFFREHAAGNFGALLYGIVHDPAMIRYLDNNKNAKGKPNENLAREILELFSMGVDNGYTEQDIIEAARALTGYNFDHATGTFRFDYNRHDNTEKTIFGKTGHWTGDDLVRLILEQPQTAQFIAKKLFEYFAYQDPSPETVERLASVLRGRDYELQPMLRNLFLSEEFYSAQATGNQIKSPVELVVGLLRDLGAQPTAYYEPLDSRLPKGGGFDKDVAFYPLNNYKSLDIAIQQMGMELLEPPDVKGWRYGRTWISSQRLFTRYNAVADLVQAIAESNQQAGVDLVGRLAASGCQSSAEAVDHLAKSCLLRPLTEEKRNELIGFLGELPPCDQWLQQADELNRRLRVVLVLLLSMPEYQMS